jgi:hypothetical protein
MKCFIEGESRSQAVLFPDHLDEWIAEDKLEARKQQLETSVERYLADLDRADRDPELVPKEHVEHLKEKIAKVRAQMKVLDAIDEQLAESAGRPSKVARWNMHFCTFTTDMREAATPFLMDNIALFV